MSWMPQHIVCMYVGDKCTSERDSQRQPWRRSEEARGGPGSATTCPEGEEGQSITHADRMHPGPPRAHTGAGIAAGVDRDTHSHAAHAHDLHRGAGAAQAAGGGAGLPWTPSRPAQPLRRSTGHDRRCRGTATHPPQHIVSRYSISIYSVCKA